MWVHWAWWQKAKISAVIELSSNAHRLYLLSHLLRSALNTLERNCLELFAIFFIDIPGTLTVWRACRPFSYDVRAFQAIVCFSSACNQPRQQSSPDPSLDDDRGLPAEEPKRKVAIEPDARGMPLQRVPSIPPAGPATFAEPRAVVASAHGDRNRLTPDQAIHIYNLGRNRVGGTATLLALQYGITAKAIREIWTRKSWAPYTRPHWIADSS